MIYIAGSEKAKQLLYTKLQHYILLTLYAPHIIVPLCMLLLIVCNICLYFSPVDLTCGRKVGKRKTDAETEPVLASIGGY